MIRRCNPRSETDRQAAAPGRWRFRDATAAVEFAVLLPFLTCMLLGVTDLGRLFYYSMTIENCLHNSLLWVSHSFDNQNQQWIGSNQYWQGPNGQVTTSTAAGELDAGNISPVVTDTDFSISKTKTTDADGNTIVVVTVSYTFQPLVPYPGLPSQVPIQRTGQIRVAPAVPN